MLEAWQTPCNWCGHERLAHHDECHDGWRFVAAENRYEAEPDACECIGFDPFGETDDGPFSKDAAEVDF